MQMLERFIQPHPSIQDEAECRRIRFFLAMILINGMICLVAYFPLLNASNHQTAVLETIALVIASAICYCIGRTKYVHLGLHLTLSFIYFIVLGIVLTAPDARILLALVFPILVASIFLSMRWMIVWGLICFVTAGIIPIIVPGNWEFKENTLTLIFTISILNGMGVFLRNQNARQAQKELMMRQSVEAELRESRHFIERITSSAPDYIFVYDLTQNKTIYASRSREAIMGYPPLQPHENEDAFAVSIIHPDDRDAMREIGAQLRAAPYDGIFTIEYRAKFADGSWHWIFARRTVFRRDAQGNPTQVLGVAQDITMRKEIELAEIERRRFAEILRETIARVNSSLDSDEVLELIADNIHHIVAYDAATIWLINDDSAQVVARRGYGRDNEESFGKPPFTQSANTLFGVGAIVETQTVLCFADLCQEPDYVPLPGVQGMRAYLGAPMRVSGQIIGVIALESQTLNFYTAHAVERLGMFAEQVSSALQNAQLHEQSQLLSATNERQRIARDLHDSVTQTLFAASMVAQTLPILWETNRDGVKNQLDNLSQLTRGALADMRTLLVELRPAALENADLGELLGYLLDALATRQQLKVSLELEGNERLPAETQVAFYRIAQEALNNIAKHAHAKQVVVRLVRQTDAVVLTIKDDGRGFDTTEVGSDHFGLSIMRERADSIGANLLIDSAPSNGCCIQVAWQTMPVLVDAKAS